MNGHPLDDVVVAASAGAAWAFQRLYDQLAPAVVGYLRAQGSADPEDLASEVFLAVFTRIGSFSGTASAFRSWVFTIAHHRLVDERRRQRRRPPPSALDDEIGTLVGGDVEDEALASLGEQRVVALLETLSPDQRDVLTLRILGDLTVEQVAAVVGKPAGAVKALQRRGLAALRRSMSRQGVPL